MDENAEIIFEEIHETETPTDEELSEVGPSINHLAMALNTYCRSTYYSFDVETVIYTMNNGHQYYQDDKGYWLNYTHY